MYKDKKTESEYQKKYRKSNKEKIKQYYQKRRDELVEKQRKYNLENREKRIVYGKKYREEHKTEKYLYDKKKRLSDINYHLSQNLRSRMRTALKRNGKGGSAVRDLGCTIEELKKYIESKWLPQMSWDNWSFYGWHIDHIKPLSSFRLENREDFLRACHYSNLQPLWALDNLKKNDSLVAFKEEVC